MRSHTIVRIWKFYYKFHNMYKTYYCSFKNPFLYFLSIGITFPLFPVPPISACFLRAYFFCSQLYFFARTLSFSLLSWQLHAAFLNSSSEPLCINARIWLSTEEQTLFFCFDAIKALLSFTQSIQLHDVPKNKCRKSCCTSHNYNQSWNKLSIGAYWKCKFHLLMNLFSILRFPRTKNIKKTLTLKKHSSIFFLKCLGIQIPTLSVFNAFSFLGKPEHLVVRHQ